MTAERRLAGVTDQWAKKHNHDQDVTTTLKIDFGKMNPSEALISKIENPKVSVSSAENELYSPHMRVRFYFKCL